MIFKCIFIYALNKNAFKKVVPSHGKENDSQATF